MDNKDDLWTIAIILKGGRGMNYFFPSMATALNVYEDLVNNPEPNERPFEHLTGYTCVSMAEVAAIECFPRAALYDNIKDNMHMQALAQIEVQNSLAGKARVQRMPVQ